MFEDTLIEIKLRNCPVHCFTVNDCADVILAVNGSSIMVEDISEVEELGIAWIAVV